MSNETSSSSSSSSSYHNRNMPIPPSSSGFHYSDDIMYTGPFNPSPFKLLFMVNTRGHDNALRNMSMGQPHLQFAIDGLIHLQVQRASLNAIIEETNVYLANLAFNATAAGPTPLRVEGPITVPSLPVNPKRLEFHLQHQPSGLGPLPTDICNANPNDPIFLRAAETYRARIRTALELSLHQTDLCPRHTGTEPVLSGQAGTAPLVPEQQPTPSLNSPATLVHPPSSTSCESTPAYTQSIGVTSASPSPPPEPASKPVSEPTPAPPRINPFDIDNKPLAPPLSTFPGKRKIQPHLR
uniref:Uncharacterized protein n=1 Tax=Moniliophthora roreri TaxID=221103 RepID=A0A0W0FMH1_MONRR